VLVSAVTGEGIELLTEVVERAFENTARMMDLLVPYGDGKIVAELYGLDAELAREDVAEGVRIRARIPNQRAAKFERYVSAPATETTSGA